MDGVIPACCICLNSLAILDEPYRVRACGHVFHYECITSWTKKHPSCPECLVKFTTDDLQRDFVLISIIDAMKSLKVVFTADSGLTSVGGFCNMEISTANPNSTKEIKSISPATTITTTTTTTARNNSLLRFDGNDSKCLAYHPHALNIADPAVIYPPFGRWFCDVCSSATDPCDTMRHCMECKNYDMCDRCYQKGKLMVLFQTANHRHPIVHSDPRVVYHQYQGRWHCNSCRRNNEPVMYHCFCCGDFDLCDHCI